MKFSDYQPIFEPYSQIYTDSIAYALEQTREAQELMEVCFSGLKNLSFPIFDIDIMEEATTKGLQKVMESIEKKPNVAESLQKYYLKCLQDIQTNLIEELYGNTREEVIKEKFSDKRFQHPQWAENPYFKAIKQIYLLNAKFYEQLTDTCEEDSAEVNKLKFYLKQIIGAASPTNFPFTNPQVIEETIKSSGQNVLEGWRKLLADSQENSLIPIKLTDISAFKVGENLATTKGKVIFQNDLFQLIQYEPLKEKNFQRPLLVIPPWINKFYILDLQPQNSFVKWLLEQGISVFLISWVNPTEKQSNKSFGDYLIDGIQKAAEEVCQATGVRTINAVGYCTGGIGLTSLLAYLAKKKNDLIHSATLMASPIDFSQAGELSIFACEKQINKLEQYMKKKGYLDGESMSALFRLLKPDELIWSNFVNNYLLGREPTAFDMLYWNNDSTRLPAKMHSYYLKKMYVENALMTPGKIIINKTPLDLSKIKTPLFSVATMEDHIAPWRSVFAVHKIISSKDQEFVLSNSGHVAGIINHPQKNKYGFWTSHLASSPNPEDWQATAQTHPGSWWPYWVEWLKKYAGDIVPSYAIDPKKAIEDAPGSYVLAK